MDQQTTTASVVVLQPPSIVKSFNPTTIVMSATSVLTFSVTNGNTVAIDANFTDTFPAGILVAATPGVTNTCGGTVTAVAGASSVAFSNAVLAVGGCSITVNVQGTAEGALSNSVTINSTAAGSSAASTSSANLTVVNPPTIAKAFGAATLPLNTTTSLTFSIANTNTITALTGVAFTDNLPAGLVVATPGNLTSTCGGTATAVDGAPSVTLSGATLAATSGCTVSVDVQGTTAGVKNNSVQITSTNGGTGNTSSASVTVVVPPVIIKAFGAASIPLNGSTSPTFTIQNNNTTITLTGVVYSDTLPAGLIVSTPNGLTGSCGGGTITATAGTNAISLSGATLAQSSSCTFSVNVTGTTARQQNNTTGNVTSTEGGTGGTASASVNAIAPPSIGKVFASPSIPVNGTTLLTITITNPAGNTVALTGVAFTDALPTGLIVATPNGLTNTCGGAAAAVAGSGSISLAGGALPIASSCTVSANVTGVFVGSLTNITGSVSSANGGAGNTATATVIVFNPSVGLGGNPTFTPDLVVTKSHSGSLKQGQSGATFVITASNLGSAGTAGAVTVSDILPAFLTATQISGSEWTCTLGSLSCTRNDALGAGQSYPPVTIVVSVANNAASSLVNVAQVSGGGETTFGNDTANDVAIVVPVPELIPAVNDNGVVGSATDSKEVVGSRGEIMSLYGQNLSSGTDSASAFPLPVILAGTRILVNGFPVPLFYVSPAQINFQIPFEVTGSAIQIVVERGGVSSRPIIVPIASTAVGIYSASSNGTGQGAVLNQDNSPNSSSNPASIGSVISIYVTGLGSVAPPLATGQPGGSAPDLNLTTVTHTVLIGGLQAEVLFSGAAPGFVGLYQVNARIPANVTPTANTLTLNIQAGAKSSNTVTIAVK